MWKGRTFIIWANILVAMVPLWAWGERLEERQKSSHDFTQPYLLLETFKGSTLEGELNQAAAAGYRVQGFWYAGRGVVRQHGLLKKSAGASDRVEYRILEPWDTPALEKQLKGAATDGFRLLPRTLTVSTTEIRNGRGRIRLLVERLADLPHSYEYFVGTAVAEYESLDDTIQKASLEKEIQRADAEGYALVGLLPRSNLVRRGLLRKKVLQVEHIVIGEKTKQTPSLKPVQTVATSQSDRYRLIAGLPGPPLQAEVNDAKSDGFRLAVTPPTASPEVVLVFERRADPGDVADYLIVGGAHTSVLEYQVNRAAAAGFRLCPPFVFTLRPLVQQLGMIENSQPDFAALMERRPGSQDGYEYVLSEDMDKKELAATVGEGWAPVGVSHDGGGILLFEKTSGKFVQPSPLAVDSAMRMSSGERRELDTARVSTLRKELGEAATQGYRLMRPAFVAGGLNVTVEKVADPPGRYEYLVLSDRKDSKLEARVNEAAAEGYRVVPGSIKRIPGMWGMDTVVFMERPLEGTNTHFRYRVLGAMRLSTFKRELEQAKQEGGSLVGIVGSADTDHVAVLEMKARE
jgi:hypothetical protein